jgi:hypothetical protein
MAVLALFRVPRVNRADAGHQDPWWTERSGCRPWQNGHAERLIGSIRRECLDHIVVLGEDQLHRILAAYAGYYNGFRTHLSLDKDSPSHRPVWQLGQLSAQPILGGLHDRDFSCHGTGNSCRRNREFPEANRD